MNAQDYLLRQGWAGPGTPLNPNRQRVGGPHGGLGLTKPILVARRKGNEGVGKKTTKDPTNQWWLRGFEDALKGVGPEGAGSGQSTGTARTPNALTSELYRFFVRGQGLAGTVGSQSQSQLQIQNSEKEKEEKKGKRKRDDDDGDDADKSEKKEKKKRKDKDERKESKEERRQRKLEKRLKKERKAEERKEKKLKKESKSKSKSKPEDNYPTPPSTEQDSSGQDEAVKIREKRSKSKDKKDKKESKKTKTTSSSGDDKDKESRKSKKTKKDT